MVEAIKQKLRDQLPALKALAGVGVEIRSSTNVQESPPDVIGS